MIVNYYFRQRPKGEIKLVFYNAAGDSIIAFSNKNDKHGNKLKGDVKFYKGPEKDPEVLTVDSGMNRFVWDMNYPHTRLLMKTGGTTMRSPDQKHCLETTV